MDDKIIQIIPAPSNLFVTYVLEGKELKYQVLCLGLTQSGDVVLMDVSADAETYQVDDVENFKHVFWKGK